MITHKPASPRFNSFLASGNFCRLLMTFANSLDPDQNLHESKWFDTLKVFLKEFFSKKLYEISRRRKSALNYPTFKEQMEKQGRTFNLNKICKCEKISCQISQHTSTLKAPRKKMHLKMSSAEVVCCK